MSSLAIPLETCSRVMPPSSRVRLVPSARPAAAARTNLCCSSNGAVCMQQLLTEAEQVLPACHCNQVPVLAYGANRWKFQHAATAADDGEW